MGWMDGGMEESGRTESNKDTSSTLTFDPRMQAMFYGAGDMAMNAANQPFQALDPNQYVAGPNADMQAAWSGIRGLRTPGEFGQAANLYGRAAGFQPTAYNAPDAYGAPQAFGNYGLQTTNMPQNFSAEAAKQYMSPFDEAVTEQARQQAIREGSRQAAQDQMQAVFGAGPSSSGAALKGALANQNLTNTLADITAKGNAASFSQAREQFNTDVGRRLGAEQFNVGAGERAYGLNQATAAQNEAARARAYGLNAETGLNAFKANEDARQFAANLGLNAAQGLGALGTARQNADIQRLGALSAAGGEQRGIESQKMALKLSEALAKRGYPMQQASQLAQILATLPSGRTQTGTESGTTREFSATPSLMSQIGGLAGAAASMYMGLPGQLGGGSLGGAFSNAKNWWSGGGGGGGPELTDMSSYWGNNPRGSNGFSMNS